MSENSELVKKFLDKRIVHDNACKQLIFYAGISSFLNEPVNVFMKGASGIGKTYITREALKVFPQENIKYLAGMSPKAMFHQKGELRDSEGNLINFNEKPIKPLKKLYEKDEDYQKALEEYRKSLTLWNIRLEGSYKYINWSGKIVVFLEEPSEETMEILRPFMSHDKERIEYEFTDKSSSGKMITSRVIIEGHPSFIFCSASHKFMQEITTRFFTVSPTQTKEKIRDAKKLITRKYAFPMLYEKPTPEEEKVREIIEQIMKIPNFKRVIVPFLGLDKCFPEDIPRDMRDYEHFEQLCSAIALTNRTLMFKQGNDTYFMATMNDVLIALNIYDDIIETTRAGISERLLDFYWNVIAKKQWFTKNEENGWLLTELVDAYNNKYSDTLSTNSLRYQMHQLDKAGFVKTETEKKAYRYIPIKTERDNRLISSINNFSSSVLEKNLRKLLEWYRTKGQFLHKEKILNSLEEIFEIVYKNTASVRLPSEPFPQSIQEKKL